MAPKIDALPKSKPSGNNPIHQRNGEALEISVQLYYNKNDKCPGRMIGKSTRQDVPGPAKRATRPFEKVTFDLIISTVTSVEGYNSAALWVDVTG